MMRTWIGLLYSNALRFRRGSFESGERWAPAIRCLYSDRPLYDWRNLDFRDLAGRPLDLHRSFTLADDREEMSNFLRQTGYLVVRQAFEPELIARLSRELDRVRDEATLAAWRRTGVYEVLNARTGQTLPMGVAFLDDVLAITSLTLDL